MLTHFVTTVWNDVLMFKDHAENLWSILCTHGSGLSSIEKLCVLTCFFNRFVQFPHGLKYNIGNDVKSLFDQSVWWLWCRWWSHPVTSQMCVVSWKAIRSHFASHLRMSEINIRISRFWVPWSHVVFFVLLLFRIQYDKAAKLVSWIWIIHCFRELA